MDPQLNYVVKQSRTEQALHNPLRTHPTHSQSRAMATIHFPQTAPTDARVTKLIMKRRAIHHCENSLSQVSVDRSVVASIPSQYLDHIKRFIWREDCLRLVLHLYNVIDIPQKLHRNLKMVLCYMEEVFKCFIAEIPKELDQNNTSRSRTFDSYLKVEYWVGRHEPVYVREYRRSNDRNIDRSDVQKLGIP